MAEKVAENLAENPAAAVPEDYDGRFGEEFDDEIHLSGVMVTTVILGGLCVLAMFLMWFMRSQVIADIDQNTPPPPPLVAVADPSVPVEERMPADAPKLQPSPEAELRAMRAEEAKILNGYGWVDESAGIVYVPIDVAMELVLDEGLPVDEQQAEGESAGAETAAAETAPEPAQEASDG